MKCFRITIDSNKNSKESWTNYCKQAKRKVIHYIRLDDMYGGYLTTSVHCNININTNNNTLYTVKTSGNLARISLLFDITLLR
jgi:viroplasmin and RNaseH domain-containing protein